MTTYLELTKAVARDSHTLDPSLITTVQGATGRVEKFAYWTDQAWQEIQTWRTDWNWMRREWTHALVVNSPKYTPGAFDLADWSRWVTDGPQTDGYGTYHPLSLYDPDLGVSDEGSIPFIPWERWRIRYGRGEQTATRPTEYSVSPVGELCFGVKPDKAYIAKGEYFILPVGLENDDDEPDCPGGLDRELIVSRALILLSEHDEAILGAAAAARRFEAALGKLEGRALPEITIGGPLA